jgi:hypothetical protein
MSPRLLRPLASGFNPKSIAGLYLWLDAADSSTVTLNSNNVSEWRDKSGSSRHFAQSAAGLQPAYTQAGENGKNCLTFDASKLLVSSSASSVWSLFHDGSAIYDIYIVWKAAAGSTTLRAMLATGDSTPNNRSMYLWHDFRSGASTFVYAITALGSGDANRNSQRSLPGVSANVLRVGRVTADPANATLANRGTLRADGRTASTGPAFTGIASAGDPMHNLTIGSLSPSNASFGFAGTICEILVYSVSPAVAARQRIENYLNRKWNAAL